LKDIQFAAVKLPKCPDGKTIRWEILMRRRKGLRQEWPRAQALPANACAEPYRCAMWHCLQNRLLIQVWPCGPSSTTFHRRSWLKMARADTIYSQGRSESGRALLVQCTMTKRGNTTFAHPKGLLHNSLLTPGSRPSLCTSLVYSFAVLRALKSQEPSRNPQHCIVGHKHYA